TANDGWDDRIERRGSVYSRCRNHRLEILSESGHLAPEFLSRHATLRIRKLHLRPRPKFARLSLDDYRLRFLAFRNRLVAPGLPCFGQRLRVLPFEFGDVLFNTLRECPESIRQPIPVRLIAKALKPFAGLVWKVPVDREASRSDFPNLFDCCVVEGRHKLRAECIRVELLPTASARIPRLLRRLVVRNPSRHRRLPVLRNLLVKKRIIGLKPV